MVVINGIKYACERCIRGHRVTTCTHTDQPLTMIKPKGRPALQCQHCREQRKVKNQHNTCKCGKKSKANGSHLPSCLCYTTLHCTCGSSSKTLAQSIHHLLALEKAKRQLLITAATAEVKKKLISPNLSDDKPAVTALPKGPGSSAFTSPISDPNSMLDGINLPFEGAGYDLFAPNPEKHEYRELANEEFPFGAPQTSPGELDVGESMFPLFPLIGQYSFEHDNTNPLLGRDDDKRMEDRLENGNQRVGLSQNGLSNGLSQGSNGLSQGLSQNGLNKHNLNQQIMSRQKSLGQMQNAGPMYDSFHDESLDKLLSRQGSQVSRLGSLLSRQGSQLGRQLLLSRHGSQSREHLLQKSGPSGPQFEGDNSHLSGTIPRNASSPHMSSSHAARNGPTPQNGYLGTSQNGYPGTSQNGYPNGQPLQNFYESQCEPENSDSDNLNYPENQFSEIRFPDVNHSFFSIQEDQLELDPLDLDAGDAQNNFYAGSLQDSLHKNLLQQSLQRKDVHGNNHPKNVLQASLNHSFDHPAQAVFASDATLSAVEHSAFSSAHSVHTSHSSSQLSSPQPNSFVNIQSIGLSPLERKRQDSLKKDSLKKLDPIKRQDSLKRLESLKGDMHHVKKAGKTQQPKPLRPHAASNASLTSVVSTTSSSAATTHYQPIRPKRPESVMSVASNSLNRSIEHSIFNLASGNLPNAQNLAAFPPSSEQMQAVPSQLAMDEYQHFGSTGLGSSFLQNSHANQLQEPPLSTSLSYLNMYSGINDRQNVGAIPPNQSFDYDVDIAGLLDFLPNGFEKQANDFFG